MLKCFGFFFYLMLGLAFPFWGSGSVTMFFWELLAITPNGLYVSFIFDPLGLGFGVVLAMVVWQVSSYSFGYMEGSSCLKVFYGPLTVFVLSMYILIFVPDLVMFFLAWDGLGVSSFLLVLFYSGASSSGASLITILTNRLGDGCFLMGCVVMMGDMDFSFFCSSVGISGFLFLLSSFSKSAQWPLSSWLPAAMAAPTPISSLVHSSTLVTAGVFLSIRMEGSVWGLCSGAMWIPCFTLLMACLSACLSYDLKRIIAMSTMGHLSLMFVALMSGALNCAFFHLLSHAVFKCLLFMSGGNAISFCGGHSQDIRNMGRLWNVCSVTSSMVVIGLGSLGGVPFLSGFFSKDCILEEVSCSSSGSSLSIIVSVPLSVLYSVRVGWYLMSGGGSAMSFGGCGPLCMGPLITLGYGSIFLGWAMEPIITAPGAGTGWSSWWWIMSLSGLGCLMSVLLGGRWLGAMVDFHGINNLCYLRSPLHLLGGATLGVSLYYVKNVEHGWFEFMGPQGVKGGLKKISILFILLEW